MFAQLYDAIASQLTDMYTITMGRSIFRARDSFPSLSTSRGGRYHSNILTHSWCDNRAVLKLTFVRATATFLQCQLSQYHNTTITPSVQAHLSSAETYLVVFSYRTGTGFCPILALPPYHQASSTMCRCSATCEYHLRDVV